MCRCIPSDEMHACNVNGTSLWLPAQVDNPLLNDMWAAMPMREGAVANIPAGVAIDLLHLLPYNRCVPCSGMRMLANVAAQMQLLAFRAACFGPAAASISCITILPTATLLH